MAKSLNIVKAGMLIFGLLALFSRISLAVNPTVEGKRVSGRGAKR